MFWKDVTYDNIKSHKKASLEKPPGVKLILEPF